MRRIMIMLAMFALTLPFLAATPASAQATRTWVSGVGDDANPCSRTAPCKTFAGAISKTAAGGEINCLDPGGFGALTITKSITVSCSTGTAGVLVSGTSGFVVNAGAADRIVLEGLDIEGVGSGIHGVNILAGGTVEILRSTIRRFTGNGVNATASTNGMRVIIRDSVIAFNAGGVNVQGAGGVPNSATIINTLIDTNASFAVQANGSGNAIALITSYLIGSPTGVNALGGSAIAAFGPSNVITGAGAPTLFVPFK